MFTILILGISCLLSYVEAVVIPSEEFPSSVELVSNDGYWLFWKIEDTDITFEIHVQTLGWVAFGISPNGGMTGSDIVMGYVKEGVIIFSDRHAVGNMRPIEDTVQNWKLISGSESGSYTVLKFSRQFYTCDFNDDRNITESTLRVIWAYHPDDPDDLNSATMHEAQGSRSLVLLNYQSEEPGMPANTINVDFVMNSYSVPSYTDTIYYCKLFEVPDPDIPKHILKIEPLVEPGNERLVHHMVLYYCDDGVATDHVEAEGLCHSPDMSNHRSCLTTMFGWAVGGTAFSYPEHVGFPVGGTGKIRYIQLEIHYDNSDQSSGLIDSSGMRLYMSETLREYDTATTWVGVTVSPYHIIPAGIKSFQSDGYCSQTCLQMVLGDDSIYIFSVTLHTHLAGTSIKLRHFRDGRELPPIAYDDAYDFNYQETRNLASEVTVKSGDSLKVECIYNTEGRHTLTNGGLGTENEMCMAFINYYPFKQLYSCSSVTEPRSMAAYYDLEIEYDARHAPIVSSGEYEGWGLLTVLSWADWEEEYMNERTQSMAIGGPFQTECKKTATEELFSTGTVISPADFDEYEEYGVCVDDKFLWNSQAATTSYQTAQVVAIVTSIISLTLYLHLI